MQTTREDESLLLLDDGELDAVARLLDRSAIAYRRLRGAEVGDDIAAPNNLLIATPRHASKVRPGAPKNAEPGRPVRIIAVEEDSPSLRSMMRSLGFGLLVRQPAHDAVWRLLIQRALFQGDERRREARLPLGAQIAVEATGATPAKTSRPCELVDISNRGCHFIGDEPFPPGATVSFELGAGTTGAEPLMLVGKIVRTGPWLQGDPPGHSCAMVFRRDLDEASRSGLARMINARISGPLSLASDVPDTLSLPACDSPVLPGLPLDNETDPPVKTDFEVQLALEAHDPDPADRRKLRRADYQQRIEVGHSDETAVLMGRDLSSGGMRVERFADATIGAHLDLALYGPSDSEPLHIDAEIIRDDGEQGVALRFCNLSRDEGRKLERFVACLPAVESLEEGEAMGMGSVLTEVLSGEREAS